MAVKIRLARRGRKKLAMFDVVVADARSPRDGRFIEKLGTYNPNTNPATINLNEEKAVQWLLNGAQPSDTVRAMLSYKGVMLRKHLQLGVNKGAITQEVADGKFDTWKEEKESKIVGKADSAVAKRDAEKQTRLDAEAKKNAARAEALAKKYKVEEPVVVAPAAAAPVAEEVEAAEVQATEVAPVEAQAEEVAAEEVVTEEAAPAAEAVEETPAAEEVAPAEAPVAEETPAPAPDETPAGKAE